ncbi:MAG: hypothetical protein ACTSR7_17915 [Promethearchaeota archaeon]
MEHKKWVILCIIGGILMILGSIVGSLGFIGTALTLIAGVMGPEMATTINMILTLTINLDKLSLPVVRGNGL